MIHLAEQNGITPDTGAPRSGELNVAPLLGTCPLPIFNHPQIVMGHGRGGKLSAELIDKVFVSAFRNPTL